jgi:hypothetical protein
MNIVNLTPDTIAIRDTIGGDILIPASEKRATVSSLPGEDENHTGEYEGHIISLRMAPKWGEVTGLPDPQEGVIYVVSALVAGRVQRPDVYSPDTGPDAVRESGQVVAVRRLIRSC